MRKSWYSLIAITGAVGLLASCSSTEQVDADAHEPQVELVAATINSSSTFFGQALIAFADAIEEESDGEISVKVFTGGQLGDASSSYQSVISGDIDIIYTDTGWFAEHQPIFDVLATSYLFDDQEHYDSIVNETDGLAYFEDLLRESPGLETIMYTGGLERNIMSTFPIESVNDLQGRNMRTGGSGPELEWWQLLGANPLNVNFSEVYSAIQTGVVDGGHNSLDSMVENRFGEVVDYVARTQHVLALGFVVMNGERYDNLSDEHKEAIAAASDRVQSEYTDHAFEMADDYKDRLVEDFNITFTDFDKEEFIEISRNQRMEIARELGAEEVIADIFD
ncbi:TRAP transporter substrate-binding protein [Alkalicoccobacillus porphyridii]|uniref:TRAP transporter substrate-binding protein n=1 Tax=Alkalicoccobacillus porphyridii TaxID=2597270 RepID=A0A554A0T6_9BACI|nr:TRAP transporter substrate-binding protein [Alkalicoccobacillus porphyridii]TSB47305.1 TRAP transporter substrate-binding protein [Alkalicoccobacillus porphyridii]